MIGPDLRCGKGATVSWTEASGQVQQKAFSSRNRFRSTTGCPSVNMLTDFSVFVWK
jgi:hypothetical protein